MKLRYFLLLSACALVSQVEAEPQKLPPVLDNSVYSDKIPSTQDLPSPPSYDNIGDIQELKNDISSLKTKLREQEKTIDDLKRSNEELQKKLSEASKENAAAKKYSLPNAPVLDASPVPVSADSDKDRYQRATALLKKMDNDAAITEFQALIKAYPNSSYADNAQYWIGVALANKGDNKGAMQAFDRLARVYPNSDKVPDGLYKLGSILASVKNTAKAREYFDYVIEKYPGTEGANLAAKAKAKLQ